MNRVDAERPAKTMWVDAPSLLLLDQACLVLHHAFDAVPYLVGSALHRRDFRDVDVRMILTDEQYAEVFPGSVRVPESLHARWSVMCAGISLYLRKTSGLPVDFQFQQMTDANRRYDGPRHPLGIFPAFAPDREGGTSGG